MHRIAKPAAALLISALAGCATANDEAQTSSCLSEPEFLSQRHNNTTPNYTACASLANLKVMVANPDDLTEGRPLGSANGQRETLAVRNYQQGMVKPSSPAGASSPAPAAAPAAASGMAGGQ